MTKQTLAIAFCIMASGMCACSNNSGSTEAGNNGSTQTTANNEPAEGEWKDITSSDNWRNYNEETLAPQWKNEDGMLVLTGEGGGDIVSKEEYKNFELELDWNISEGGNSGLFYNVVESEDPIYYSGPEYQLLDNERHADAKIRKHRAGDNYDVQQSVIETAKPAGEWNHTRLVVNNGHVEHYLNGEKVVDYDLWTPAWEDSVANSKFAEFSAYGMAKSGYIGLQDHGDSISFKNIRIREL